MTAIGKLLVFANLIIGMAFLSWSISLYTLRVEWLGYAPPAGEKVEGELERLKAEIDQLTTQIKLASPGWGQAQKALAATEINRDQRRVAYKQRLELAQNDPKTGFFADEYLPDPTDPLRKSSLLDVVVKRGPALKGPDQQDLRGANTLLETINKNNQEIGLFVKQLQPLREKQAELSLEEKEWHEKANRQTAIRENLYNEQRYLSDFEVNWNEQLVTGQRRKDQLLARLAEFRR